VEVFAAPDPGSPNVQAPAVGAFVDPSVNWTVSGAGPTDTLDENAPTGGWAVAPALMSSCGRLPAPSLLLTMRLSVPVPLSATASRPVAGIADGGRSNSIQVPVVVTVRVASAVPIAGAFWYVIDASLQVVSATACTACACLLASVT
jgi:hypothetical protein